MNINQQSWHFSLFQFGLKMIDRFLGQLDSAYPYSERYEKRTNLCHYMRVILVYVPMILGLYAATVGGAVYVAMILPIKLFGISSCVWVIAFAASFITLTALVVFAMMLCAELYGRLSARVRVAAMNKQFAAATVTRGPGFGELLLDWLEARKARVCPLITFEDSASVQEGNS